MTDKLKMVQEKIAECSDLYSRMDDTMKLLQDKYTLTNFEGEEVRKSISVTRNTAAWQANVMSDKLLKLLWQTKVESSNKLSKTLISHVEQFSDDVWAQIDEFLANEHGLSGGLNTWQAKKVVTRGPIGARLWLYFDKQGKLVINCLPLDMRWCPYELNRWYCIRSWRTAAQIQRAYPKGTGVDALTGNSIEVSDLWDSEGEEVYINQSATPSQTINGVKIWEQANYFKVPPFVVVQTSTGFQFRGKKFLEHESESFDWLDRKLYDEANRSASIAQSLALDNLIPGYTQPKLPGKALIGQPAALPDEVVPVEKGEEPIRMERGDVSQAYLKAAMEIDRDIARGGVTDTESGNNTGGNTALWVTTQNAILAEKLSPYQDALATFKQKAMRMIIDQYIKLGDIKKSKEVDMGITGMTHRYSADELGDPSTYRITYIPKLNSKEVNIANTVIGLSQRGWLPDRWILENTMEAEDPDGILRDMRIQRAEEIDPATGMFETARSFARAAKDMEGEEADFANMESMYWTEMGVLRRRADKARIQATMQPQTSATTTPLPGGQREEVKPKGMTSLAGGGGGLPLPPQLEANTVAKAVAK